MSLLRGAEQLMRERTDSRSVVVAFCLDGDRVKDALIRSASIEDVETLAALGRETFIDMFVDGFGVPYPPDDLNAYLEKSFSVAKMREMLLDATQAWWIASAPARSWASPTPGLALSPRRRVPSRADMSSKLARTRFRISG